MSEQTNSHAPQPLIVQFEVVPEDEQQEDIADTSEVRQSLIDELRNYSYTVKSVYTFSGHAHPVNDDIYFVTVDFDIEKAIFNPSGYISMRWLHRTLYQSELVKAGCVLIILDCCYAGNMAELGINALHESFKSLLDKWDKGPSDKTQQNNTRVVLAATGYNIQAEEDRQKNGHGLMTKYLLRAFRGDKEEQDRAYNHNGDVTIHLLSSYIQTKMPKEQLATLLGKQVGIWILASHSKLSEKNHTEAQRIQENEMLALLRDIQGGIKRQPYAQPFDHDKSICTEASFDDLDTEVVTKFFKQEKVLERVQDNKDFRPGSSHQELLQMLNFLQNSHPTHGTLLCFGKKPGKWIARATTRCINWGRNDRHGGWLKKDAGEFDDGLLIQFDKCRGFLRECLYLPRVINKDGSKEELELPARVLDEALANALVHREYRGRNDCVHVEVFNDRIEITSPGDLPQHMNLEKILEEHGSHLRNEHIAEIFHLYGHIEQFGTGIPRMQDLMEKANLPSPEFKLTADKRLKVILYRPKQVLIEEKPSMAPSSIWHVPYRRNPFFTGREDILINLHTILNANNTVALTQPPAISGLGGIGKTQTAIEYAYRYRDYYRSILWVKADTPETLTSDFVTIASLLNLREKEAQDQNLMVRAVKYWLEANSNWLIIFDNADDLHMVHDFLPAGDKGHILLTTRAHAMGGIARRVEIEKMDPEQGALFLLRRAGIITQDAPLSSATEADCSKAKDISAAIDGLPLALDQAGAFIEETAYSLSEYLAIYHKQRAELHKHRGGIASPHPDPVAATWSLSFEKVEKANPAAAELLCFCAFLHPDAIPEEIITEGASELSPLLQPVADNPIQLNKAIGELLKYSLIRRDPKTKMLTVHRLVQAVLKDGMGEEEQRQWAERTVLAVNRAFPDPSDFTMWNLCERCLPHAQTCALLIDQWDITSEEAALLLNQAGYFLKQRARYAEAEPLYQRAIAIREKTLGKEHSATAIGLNNLASLYDAQGKYEQAESLYQHALVIREKLLGLKHPDVAQSLNNLARLYDTQGKYEQAEPLYQRALAIDEQLLGSEHPEVATDFNNLALLYYNQGMYAQAEPLYQRALAIGEQMLGSEHPEVATDLNNLALLYQAQGKYEQAEPLLQRALAICEKILGAEHPDTATSLNNLALLYYTQGRYEQAEPLYQRALRIWEQNLGPEHPHVATLLKNYADLLGKTEREAEAAKLEERAMKMQAKYI